MSLDIRLVDSDGTEHPYKFTPTEQETTMPPTERTITSDSATDFSLPTRTRRNIVDDLEAAEAKCHEMQKAIVVERQKVAALTVELRNYGRPARKART